MGGCAAALAAVRCGMRVVLTEETDWIGGQLTSQAVPPDEHPWIEEFGATRLYRDYRNAVRAYYRRNYPLTEAARSQPYFNPGNSWVSRITHEPRVSLAVLESMLAAHVSAGRLILLIRHKLARPRGIVSRFGPLPSTNSTSLEIDDPGRLLPRRHRAGRPAAAGRRRVCDRSRTAQTDEPHAPDAPSPTTSRRSPAASRSITSTARTTPSTDPPSTTSGGLRPRGSRRGRDACST